MFFFKLYVRSLPQTFFFRRTPHCKHLLPSLLTTFFHKKEVPFCFHRSLFNSVNSIIYDGDQRIEKREIYKADRNPPIAASKRYLLTPLSSSFSFSETYNMIGVSEKRNPCLNFKCPVLEVLKSAIFDNYSPKWR